MILGLRIDVDTLYGLFRGVERLLPVLAELKIEATFFVPMGRDRMGRNAKRILGEKGLSPSLLRYLRIYPWQTLLNGTLRTPPHFAEAGAGMMLRMRREGHEVGLHSFDHYAWQNGISDYSPAEIEEDFRKCIMSYTGVFGALPRCCAAPGWRATEISLSTQEGFGFEYASDTRGKGPFYPSINGRTLSTLQIPVTLPTLDELLLVGRKSLALPDAQVHVYCAHAEVEGLSRLTWFRQFLEGARRDGTSIVPLLRLAERFSGSPEAGIRTGRVPGRASPVTLEVNT
jgi:undecaprenyl phosphate-alpha-L-ara4FN deformylase